jgi:hypothetical protein
VELPAGILTQRGKYLYIHLQTALGPQLGHVFTPYAHKWEFLSGKVESGKTQTEVLNMGQRLDLSIYLSLPNHPNFQFGRF